MKTSLVCFLLCIFAVQNVSADKTGLRNGNFELVDEVLKPSAWQLKSAGHDIEITTKTFVDGRQALRLHGPKSAKSGFVFQSLDPNAVTRQPLLVSAYIRSENIVQSASLVIVVAGKDGPLFVEDMRAKPVAGTTDWTRFEVRVPLLPGATSFKVGALVIGEGTAWFDKFEINPIASQKYRAAPPGNKEAARALLKEAFQVISQRYYRPDNVDWLALSRFVETSLVSVNGFDDAHAAITSLVTQVGDSHATFVRPGTRKVTGDQTDILSEDRNDIDVLIQQHDECWLLKPPVMNMGASGLEMQTLIAKLEARVHEISLTSHCGWIVDLRGNAGGNMWQLLDALQPFLHGGSLGGHYDKEGNHTEWRSKNGLVGVSLNGKFAVKSAMGLKKQAYIATSIPVVVLIDRETASAAEAAAIALSSRVNLKTMGQVTAGLLSANAVLELTDGSKIILPIGGTVDSNGRKHDAVQPDVLTIKQGAQLTELAKETLFQMSDWQQ